MEIVRRADDRTEAGDAASSDERRSPTRCPSTPILDPDMRTLLAPSLALALLWSADAAAQLRYTVDVRDGASHAAAVTLQVDSLAARDSIFQFAATAPGTYQTMN